MPAPTGNKNAEKWTLPRTLEILTQIETYALSGDCLYLGNALAMADVYNDVWAYWRRKWKTNPDIITRMKKIMQKFEVRIFDKMVKKEIPASAGMFVLRHHYGWGKDKREEDLDLSTEDIEIIPDDTPAPEPPKQTHTTPPPVQQDPLHGIHPDHPVIGREFKQKLSAYNQAHPNKPVSRPASYFYGVPPDGSNAISFDGGYFIEKV